MVSGAGSVGVADGSFGAWRGSVCTVASTWNDSAAAQTAQWSLDPAGGEFGAWQGDLNNACGAIYKGSAETWAKAASGTYDSRWTTCLSTMAGFWGAKPGVVHIRFAHEFNLSSSNWSVTTSGEAASFVTAFRRFRTIQLAQFPAAKLCWSPNNDTNAGADSRSSFPGAAYCDEIAVDIYNQYAWVNTQAGFDAKILEQDSFGGPKGAERWRVYAGSVGLPMSVAEWGNNGDSVDGGDAPVYMTAFYNWLKANAGAGSGKVLYDCYFNDYVQFQLYPTNEQPNAAASYVANFSQIG